MKKFKVTICETIEHSEVFRAKSEENAVKRALKKLLDEGCLDNMEVKESYEQAEET